MHDIHIKEGKEFSGVSYTTAFDMYKEEVGRLSEGKNGKKIYSSNPRLRQELEQIPPAYLNKIMNLSKRNEKKLLIDAIIQRRKTRKILP